MNKQFQLFFFPCIVSLASILTAVAQERFYARDRVLGLCNGAMAVVRDRMMTSLLILFRNGIFLIL